MEFIETGYAMPLELWVRAAAAGLKIVEIPVPLIYLDEKRSFGGALDDGATRLEYYRRVLNNTIEVAYAEKQLMCHDWGSGVFFGQGTFPGLTGRPKRLPTPFRARRYKRRWYPLLSAYVAGAHIPQATRAGARW
jgi:hypothetical protein